MSTDTGKIRDRIDTLLLHARRAEDEAVYCGQMGSIDAARVSEAKARRLRRKAVALSERYGMTICDWGPYAGWWKE